MMKCKDIHKKMPQYLDGNLPENSSQKMETHLRSCESCSKLYQRLARAMTSFHQRRITENNPFFTTRVLANLDTMESNELKESKFILSLKPAMQIAIVVAAIFTGVVFGLNLSYSNNIIYNREDYIQALGESHYLIQSDYTLEAMFLTENTEEE